jgi:hypothetical protein
MPKRGNAPIKGELLQGTLDLLVLRTLAVSAAHGHTIAHATEYQSDEVLQVEHWLALSGVAPPRRSRLDYVPLGHVGKQAPRALLPADAAGKRQLTEQTNRWDRHRSRDQSHFETGRVMLTTIAGFASRASEAKSPNPRFAIALSGKSALQNRPRGGPFRAAGRGRRGRRGQLRSVAARLPPPLNLRRH